MRTCCWISPKHVTSWGALNRWWVRTWGGWLMIGYRNEIEPCGSMLGGASCFYKQIPCDTLETGKSLINLHQRGHLTVYSPTKVTKLLDVM